LLDTTWITRLELYTQVFNGTPHKKTMTADSLWKAVLGEIQTIISPVIYKTWLQKSYAKDLTDTSIEIYFHNLFAITNTKKIHPLIQQTLNKIAGREVEMTLKVGEEIKKETNSNNGYGPLFQGNKSSEEVDVLSRRSQRAGLSPFMTFDNYIVGPNNQLAYAIGTAVVDNPGQRYNPYFLYSGVGLGKTHLIQAIGNEIIRKKPDLKVIYTTGESFMNELIMAIRSGQGKQYNPAKFRKKYREVDVLLIDDIQFIAGTDSTQQEFFHTFNALHMSQRQIVITSDRHPSNFNNLEDRITSRFSSGMIADISPPDVDMRLAILQEKRDQNRDEISDEVISFLAANIETNIRELEGAYNKVIAEAKTGGKQPTTDLTRKALKEVIKDKTTKQINLNDILKTVATYYSVKVGDIKGKRRTQNIVIPRQVAMYLMYDLTQTPYETIGEVMGGRDHTTIMHGVKKVGDGMGNPQKVEQDLVNIRNELYSS